MKAVVIGPGRIGCGFAGQLLRASGYELTFVARDMTLADHLRRAGSYRVILAGESGHREIVVDGFQVLGSGDVDGVARAISEADVVATAVGPDNLPAVAPLIAAGLARTRLHTNVIAFEDLINAGPRLRRLVAASLPADRMAHPMGFSGAVVSRTVSRRIGNPAGDHPLTFIGDAPELFMVHHSALRSPLPEIRGMVTTDNYVAWGLRKLYTFGAGHATTAYLGSLQGYQYIHTAIRDAGIRSAVLSAMREGQRELAAQFGAEIAGSEEDLERIILRFENAALNDPIQRVGREPHSKLGALERLAGAARMSAKVEVAALRRIWELDAGRGSGAIAASLNQLAAACHQGNLLLSLDHRMWAWR